MLQALGRQENIGRRQGDHGDALAIADGLAADRLARHRIQHADQVGRHGKRLGVAMRHDPFVLEVDRHDRAAPIVQPVEPHHAAQKALGGAARDVDHLALVEQLARLDAEDRRHRVVMLALGLPHGVTDLDRLGRGAVDAPLLDLGAGARCLAGRRDRAELDADLAADPLHPLPGRHLVDHRFQPAHIDGGERTGIQITDRHRGHLRFGIGPAHHVGIDDRSLEMGRRHQRLDRISAADLERHDPAKFLADMLFHQRHGAGDGAAVGQPFLADQRRTHVRHRRDPVVVGELLRRHQLHTTALLVEGPHVQQAEIRAAAAAGAQHPGANGQRFDVVERDVA